eukprot:SAG31_NODE_2658_length_5286_cov_2.941585_2_plen_295_part_00
MCSLLFGSARAKNVQATQRTISSLLLVAVALCGAGSCAVAAQPQHQPELNCVAPTAIAHRARRLCGGMRARDALLAAGLSATVAEEAGSVLLGLGFETALDLRLLVGKELREEFAAELKASRLSISDRAKIQLLVGDGAEPHSVQQGGARSSATVDRSTQWSEQIEGRDDGCSFRRRQQSEGRDDGSSFRRRQQSDVDDGLSTDTLAIVLSVLVGAAGCELRCVSDRVEMSLGLMIVVCAQTWCKRTRRDVPSEARTRKLRSCISPSRRDSVSTSRCWRRSIESTGAAGCCVFL